MRFTIVGNGNMAWHFLHAFNRAGHICTEIIGRSPRSAGLVLPSWSHYRSLSEGNFTETDICFVCVSDDAIEEVVSKLDYKNTIVTHCSGTMSLELLNKFEKRAVNWPIYSLTKNVPVDYSVMPVCIESDNFVVFQQVDQFFSPITRITHPVNEIQRRTLHLSAVFANNFTNYIYMVSAELCEKQGLSFDLIKPIIVQTTEKVRYQDPATVQTGPASRQDLAAISKHLELLDGEPDYKTIYMLITEMIFERFGSQEPS